MKIIEDQEKRLKKLIRKTAFKLDSKIWLVLKKRVEGVRFDWNREMHYRTNGAIIETNASKTKFIIYLNLFTLRIFSDDAVIGVIAHEFAHIWAEYKKTSEFRKFLLKKNKFLHKQREKTADKKAISWGFKKEITQMRKEACMPRITITNKQPIFTDIKDAHTQLSLVCNSCSRKYQAEYFSDRLLRCYLFIYEQKVPRASVESMTPISDLDIIEKSGVPCINCKKSRLIIKKREKVTEPMSFVLSDPNRLFGLQL